MKRQILYFALICVVPAIFYYLSLGTVIPMPEDEKHTGLTEVAQCLECHGEGMENARSQKHPPKDRCDKCH